MATYKYYPIDLPILFIEAQIFVAIKRNSHFCPISRSLLITLWSLLQRTRTTLNQGIINYNVSLNLQTFQSIYPYTVN